MRFVTAGTVSSKRSARSSRSCASTGLATSGWSATTSSRSPSSASSRRLSAASSSAPRNFAVGERQQHGQRLDALAQVGAGGLARLARLAAHVDEVVGQLEGDADDLADVLLAAIDRSGGDTGRAAVYELEIWQANTLLRTFVLSRRPASRR